MTNNISKVQLASWGVTLTSIVLAVVVWGQSLKWHIFGMSIYLLFPIFGLIAFSLLWSQYISLAIKQYFKSEPSSLTTYFNITGWLVLVAILLHPGLLIWQLWRSGFGLPPNSETKYVAPALKAFIVLGMINLTILLLFEFRRIFANRSWWHYFTYIVDLVVLSVFYHGLKLGSQIQTGWYRKVWFFYGISFVIVLLYIYRGRFLNYKRQKS